MRFAACVALVEALVVGLSTTSPAQTSTTLVSRPPPAQDTVVHGTPPGLAGRWLALGWLGLQGDNSITVPAFWDIAVHDGKPQLRQRFVALPAPLKAALEEASAAGRRWEPSAADLATITAGWDRLVPDSDARVARVEHEIATPDGFDDSLKAEPRTREATWVVRQRVDMDPSGAPVIRQVNVYAALSAADGGWSGNFDAATIAAAPFPIPILAKGSFRLYPIKPAARGWLARVFDLFRGCGRGAR